MSVVRRRCLAAWLSSLPLMVGGSQVAHVLAFRLVYPDAQVRWSELLATGHGYSRYPGFLPLVLALGLAVELVGLVALVSCLGRGRQRVEAVPAWAFALLPVLGFTLQEFLERLLAGASFPWWIVLDPTFRTGLALQLPFALAAYLIARLLLRVAEHVAGALRRLAPRRRLVPAPPRPARVVCLRRLPVLASGASGRGPPPRPASAALTC